MTQPIVTVICGAFPVPVSGPVVICQPDPDQAAALQTAHAGRDDLQVICGLLAAREARQGDLTRFNLPGLCSLRAPTPALRRLFPGLREEIRDLVDLIRVSDLERVIGDAPCALWLDTGGEEAALLEALQDSPIWPQVTALHLRAGRVPLFDGACDLETLANVLRRMGFVIEDSAQEDPDLPLICAVPDPVLQDLRRRYDLLQADHAALQADHARQEQALQRADLRQEQALLHHDLTRKAHAQNSPPAPDPPLHPSGLDPTVTCNPQFQPAAHMHYRTMSPDAGFILLETRSLPRSGLHYLRQSLGDILGRNFSFCEWYTEPGCCRRIPCALTAFSEKTANSAETETDLPPLRLRMIKSHDFALSDPLHPQGGALRRMVLVRDPLEILTSWWSLQALQLNADLLRDNGLIMHKINFRHEAPLVAQAHRILDEEGAVPDDRALAQFLDKQASYLGGFAAKWGRALQDDPQGIGQAVPYHQIAGALTDLLTPYRDHMDAQTQARLAQFQARAGGFSPRKDPFHAPSQGLRDQLMRCADQFRAAAARVLEHDRWQLLSGTDFQRFDAPSDEMGKGDNAVSRQFG
jgi:hypothetical protein